VSKILSVGEDQDVAVIGTLYKDMRLKPSILDEYAKDPSLKAALGGTCFCSDEDNLVLEDEGARMTLRSECGDLTPDAVVTGGWVVYVFSAHVSVDEGVLRTRQRCRSALGTSACTPQPSCSSTQSHHHDESHPASYGHAYQTACSQLPVP
jgi:DNA polymerase delta subunit 2